MYVYIYIYIDIYVYTGDPDWCQQRPAPARRGADNIVLTYEYVFHFTKNILSTMY